MIRRIFSTYRPKIQFKKGTKSKPVVQIEAAPSVYEYQTPKYLALKKKMTDEEIDILNQGGKAPAVSWKKIAPLTDIHSPY
jgi:hypothetical protein